MATIYSSGSTTNEAKPRKGSLTELPLGRIAERLRKTDSLKEVVRDGKYDVDPKKVISPDAPDSLRIRNAFRGMCESPCESRGRHF